MHTYLLMRNVPNGLMLFPNFEANVAKIFKVCRTILGRSSITIPIIANKYKHKLLGMTHVNLRTAIAWIELKDGIACLSSSEKC